MKNVAFFILLMSFVTACKKDKTDVSNVISNGQWKITHYVDSGNNETDHFATYHFLFQDNGTVQAIGGASTASGTWNSNDDDSSNKLFISFSTSPFDSLSDDWFIIQQSSSEIKLEDISGGNGGTDYLTFNKI